MNNESALTTTKSKYGSFDYSTRSYEGISTFYTSDTSDKPYGSYIYPTTTTESNKRISPQRVEYDEENIGSIRWQCPPDSSGLYKDLSTPYAWFKLTNSAKHITKLEQGNNDSFNIFEIKSPKLFNEGRYACMSLKSTLFDRTHIYFYQLIILKRKWENIGTNKNVSVYFNQKLILNCPYGDIIKNGSFHSTPCSSRLTILERYPRTSYDVYSCSNSPRETRKLSATLSSDNCSLSLHGCPTGDEKDDVINLSRCQPPQANNSSYLWTIKRCPGKTFLRYIYDDLRHKCFPFETDICGFDYHSFRSLSECESNCIVIKAVIQRCFYPQNLDREQLCTDSSMGQYMVTYNIDHNECQWFFHRNGCPVSKNIFRTIKSCRQSCINNYKFIRMDLNKACSYNTTNDIVAMETVQRWVYVASIGDCMERSVSLSGHPYTMSFTTKAGCQLCMIDRTRDICLSRPDNGQCKKQEISWYFHYSARKCIRILDGGCGYSPNRFTNIIDCHNVCAKYIVEATSTKTQQQTMTRIMRTLTTTGTTSALSNTNVRRRVHRHLVTMPRLVPSLKTETHRPTVIPKSFELDKRLLERDPCFSNSLRGTCDYGVYSQNYTLIRYKFVPEHCQCHQVFYSGCMNDENLFDDSNDCKAACEVRLYNSLKSSKCQVPYAHNCLDQTTKNRLSNLTRYYFSLPENKCRPFTSVNTPQCLSLFFTSLEECQKYCQPKPATEEILQNRCFGNIVFDSTSCKITERTDLWFYMSSIGQCLSFSSCPVEFKGNVFANKTECEEGCSTKNIFTTCSLPVDHGVGTEMKMRYYFDIHRRKCRFFKYKGSLGNLNRFSTYEECFNICVKIMLEMEFDPETISRLEHIPSINNDYQGTSTNVSEYLVETDTEYCYDGHKFGACNDYNPQIFLTKYYYDGYRRQCEPYLFSGCGSTSRNSFDSFSQCDKMCTTRIQRTTAAVCLLKVHQCVNSSWVYWRHNSQKGACELYPSCVQSLTSGDVLFPDEENCSQTCVPPLPLKKDLFDICHLPPSIPATSNHECISPTKRWFFDHQSESCMSTMACTSYGNNFPSLLSCIQWCTPKSYRDVCKLPMDSGPCTNNNSIQYFFDWETQQCRNFTYGGCLGNRNRFTNINDCSKVCNVKNRCDILTKTTGCRVFVDVNPPNYLYNGTRNRCEKINETVCGNYLDFYSSKNQCESDCVIVDEFKTIVFHARKNVTSVVRGRCKEDLRYNNYPICSHDQQWLPRYYYDETKEECLFFYYNNCDGPEDKGNRFESLTKCQDSCIRTLTTSRLSSTTTIRPRETTMTYVTEDAKRKLVCPRPDNGCMRLITVPMKCLTDRDCGENHKCCGCDLDNSLTYQCMEPMDCMLSSYGCCASDNITMATDQLHTNCKTSPATITPMEDEQIVYKYPAEIYIECLITGDPRPEVQWVHLDTNRNMHVVPHWDLMRPLWSSVLHLGGKDVLLEGMWVCRANNWVGQDDIEMIVTTKSTHRGPSLRTYDKNSINGATKFAAQGSNILLHCPIYGVPRPTITWYHNDSAISESRDNTSIRRRYLQLNNMHLVDSGWWKCVAEQSRWSALSFMFKLVVLEPVRVLHSPYGNVIKAIVGQKVVLYCNVIGRPRSNVTWTRLKDGVRTQWMFSTIDPRILVIESVSDRSLGDYVCVVSNEVSEDNGTLTVTRFTDDDIVVLPAGFHFVGDRVTLQCPSKPTDNSGHVTWRKDNIAMMEGQSLSVTVSLHSRSESGFYSCHHSGRTYHTHLFVHDRPID